MPGVPGRDPVKAMTRLARIMAALNDAGAVGRTRSELFEVADYGEADPGTQLGKDLNHLRAHGWQIDKMTGQGEEARYRMVAGDNRLRLKLTAEQMAGLQRAIILADHSDLAKRLGIPAQALPQGVGSEVVPDERKTELTLALQAVRLRTRIRFRYKGTPRLVHPVAVRFQHVKWYLSGVEEGDDPVKHFVVAGMTDVSLDPPGSAEQSGEVPRLRLHPLLWEVDEPIDVSLEVRSEHVPDVVRWLQEPVDSHETARGARMTYHVTNRAAFRARLYALGTRVAIAGPEEFRDEVRAELRDLVGL